MSVVGRHQARLSRSGSGRTPIDRPQSASGRRRRVSRTVSVECAVIDVGRLVGAKRGALPSSGRVKPSASAILDADRGRRSGVRPASVATGRFGTSRSLPGATLPCQPASTIGVAETQQEAVAEVCGGQRIVVVRSPRPRLDRPPRVVELVAAVVHAVEDLAVPARHVDRLEDEERRRESDQPLRRPRRLVEIDDTAFSGSRGIDLDVDDAVEPLVGPDVAEALAVRDDPLLLDHEPDDVRVGRPLASQSR